MSTPLLRTIECLGCGRSFETAEVHVMRFTFPVDRYCAMCREAEDAEQAQRNVDTRIERARIPSAYGACQLANFDPLPGTGDALAAARHLIAELRAGRRRVRGILLHGPPGAGKTHLAIGLLREVMHLDGWTGLFVNVPSWLQKLRDLRSTLDADEFAWTFPQGYGLVVLDDLTAAKYDDWGRDRIYSLVNDRETRNALTIVTTNHTPGELEGNVGRRVMSRLERMCLKVRMDPPTDYRRQS